MSFVVSLMVLALRAQDPSAQLAAQVPDLAALPNTTLIAYAVEGRSPNALRASINAARPQQDGGADARTTWRYWKRWRNTASGDCDPASADVTYAITVTLPHLVDRRRLGARRLGAWDLYVATLARHEKNRAERAIAGAAEMQAAMRAATSCDAMRQAALDVEASVADASRAYNEGLRRGRSRPPTYP